MKGKLKQVALVVTILATLRLILEELVHMRWSGDASALPHWLDTFLHFALKPIPFSTGALWILALTGLTLFALLGRRRPLRRKQAPLPSSLPQPTLIREDTPTVNQPATNQNNILLLTEGIKAEWDNLEEGDREIIREMVVQGGLWESDIIALLKARGLWSRTAQWDSLADRVSFVQCDYAGYYSLSPESRTTLEGILEAEYAEESWYAPASK